MIDNVLSFDMLNNNQNSRNHTPLAYSKLTKKRMFKSDEIKQQQQFFSTTNSCKKLTYNEQDIPHNKINLVRKNLSRQLSIPIPQVESIPLTQIIYRTLSSLKNKPIKQISYKKLYNQYTQKLSNSNIETSNKINEILKQYSQKDIYAQILIWCNDVLTTHKIPYNLIQYKLTQKNSLHNLYCNLKHYISDIQRLSDTPFLIAYLLEQDEYSNIL